MELIRKLFRFIRRPLPYFKVMPYKFCGMGGAIAFYRKLILPRVVAKVRRKAQRGEKVNVLFLAMNPDMWKYDRVYRRFADDSRFAPTIVTAMRNIKDMDVRIEEQDAMVSYFTALGYNAIKGYDTSKKRWIDLKALKPDIIFHTQPYDRIIEKSFEYLNHLYALHCYSPYLFQQSEATWNWDNNLQQYCWKIFYPGKTQLEQAARISRVGTDNVVASGYCFEEEYAESAENVAAADKAWRNDRRKRIIWAPHHSISLFEWFKVSSFLEISDLMVRLREDYKDKVVFAFKPHPILRTKLYQIWGRDKTDLYYETWSNSENSFDAQGDYHALFAGSDAMIHCSGSFIVEYLYTGKPVAYVYSKTRKPPDFGPIGIAALEAHYPMHSEADIRRFIEGVVIGGEDTMATARRKVYDMYLRSPNGRPFSENVYRSILEGLEIECPNR